MRLCHSLFFYSFILSSCVRPGPTALPFATSSFWTTAPVATETPVATPTLSYLLPTPRPPEAPIQTPSPDGAHYLPAPARGPETYIVQPGDMLSAIAARYNLSVEALIQANGILDPDALEVGQILTIPVVTPQPPGPAFKIIPDSELVYGPNGRLDVAAFVRGRGGYLAGFTQDVYGEILTGPQIVERVAAAYSVSPRLLLAALEYRSGWITNPDPDPARAETPIGYVDDWYVGLFRQLVWSANMLNAGYYGWPTGSLQSWVLADGSVVPIDPSINAGTAGVQHFFARLDDYGSWLLDVSPGGFFDTYYILFGYPFDYTVEALVPPDLTQPALLLPFEPGQVWAFTGGPHAAWDSGTPYGALDFAPPGEAQGCVPSDAWVTAAADGWVTRTGDGVLALDLDLDGFEGSGWVLVYMHVESRDRAVPGTILRAGDRLGHPSCEGGISSGTHVHLARKFNGQWLPAYGAVPFNLSGWAAEGTGEEYVGSLRRGGETVESFEGNDPINQIQR
jgi:LysM repeat protein